ncbi:MAG TPA: 5-dehydro-4-deoxy-D-glucuronate isomerase [Bacteroidaceae bacterium]|nr:5-dehydro-4-deoxy-D-glucuronate isomerase [Bacteroidaceae bacterium]
MNYQLRYSNHPSDAKHYDTERLRKEFLVEKVMSPDEINLVYSMNDRFIVGGAVPVELTLELTTIEPLKSTYFCDRREVGMINIGGTAMVTVDDKEYLVNYKEALFIGAGTKIIKMSSVDSKKPAHLYFNSAPAHKSFPAKLIKLKDAEVADMGSLEQSNARRINKLLIHSVVETCQLQMGMTELKTGSVWNTMPPHLHGRRMEAYFYFEVPKGQAICHFMGDPKETRHIWLKNEQAVISPPWSIHAAAGTSNYVFIWGMAGENLDYGDMDTYQPDELR